MKTLSPSVYVDGNHRFDGVLIDMVRSDPLLEVGGILAPEEGVRM